MPCIEPRMNDRDAAPGNSPCHQIVPGALTDGVESGLAIHPGNRTLGEVDQRCHRPGHFLKCGLSEQVRHDDAKGEPGHVRQEERQLVDVLHHDVPLGVGEGMPHCRARETGKAVATAMPFHGDSPDFGGWHRSRPAGTDQMHRMAPSDQPGEQLEDVQLGSAGIRILQVLPVHQENSHNRPMARAT